MFLVKLFFGSILILLLTAISILHFYWALGGKALSDGVFPELENLKSIEIPPLPTVIVGVGLLLMSLVVAANLQWIDVGGWSVWTRRGLWAIAIIFLVRAIGEFNYVGFFKRKKKNSLFAEKDSKYYSPLCLVMSVAAFVVLLC